MSYFTYRSRYEEPLKRETKIFTKRLKKKDDLMYSKVSSRRGIGLNRWAGIFRTLDEWVEVVRGGGGGGGGVAIPKQGIVLETLNKINLNLRWYQ